MSRTTSGEFSGWRVVTFGGDEMCVVGSYWQCSLGPTEAGGHTPYAILCVDIVQELRKICFDSFLDEQSLWIGERKDALGQ